MPHPQALLNLVRKAEGFTLTPYHCPAGYLTVGYGHRTDKPSPITEAQAEEYLRADLDHAEVAALALAPALASEPARLAALTDLVFNVGMRALQGSGTVQALQAQDWPTAALKFRRWNKYRNPKTKQLEPLRGLTERREVGARWIETGTC